MVPMRGTLQTTKQPHVPLGGLTSATFLRRHWQKRPLFVRNALPHCGDWLSANSLFALAARDEVESRLVMRARGRWSVQHGPFTRSQLRSLPAQGWTLLVQGMEQHQPEAAALLQQFSFIPHARLDDLMVSYAPPGGGVGPHFDSYDVFLLQGAGTRRWRISAQKNLVLDEHAPLRILKQFKPAQEWITEHGDLLYLPPRHAHDGVAQSTCMTLSVGFRAPRKLELAQRFLEYVQDNLRESQFPGLYEDRDLDRDVQVQKHPAAVSSALLEKMARILKPVRWNESDIRRFAGCYLTEPKAQTVFQAPRRPATLPEFTRRVAAKGVRLALPTRMLFHGGHVFINGESHALPAADRAALIHLADRRAVPACTPSAAGAHLLHAWYCAGYLEV